MEKHRVTFRQELILPSTSQSVAPTGDVKKYVLIDYDKTLVGWPAFIDNKFVQSMRHASYTLLPSPD